MPSSAPDGRTHGAAPAAPGGAAAAPEQQLARLKARLAEVTDLRSSSAVLAWDQATHMPPAGAAARGRQLATLAQLAHERFVDPQVGRWLDALDAYADTLPPDSDDACLLRLTRREYERDTRVPAPFWAEMSAHTTASFQVWSAARPSGDFEAVAPYLETTLELSRRYAAYFPEAEHPADPLIAHSDEGMTVATLRPLFAHLAAELRPLVEAVVRCQAPNDGVLRRGYPVDEQLALGLELATALGYDLARGRQDVAHHPFETRFSNADVRITTRVREDDLSEGLFSTLHEAGHALYEQGVSDELDGTPLGYGASSGMHESQSRLWENLVGRGRPFWDFAFPRLQARFPRQAEGSGPDDVYRAVNCVRRSLIRTDADELTYNLHVILRFELELEMLEGRLEVRDLPAAWNERYERDLGVVADTHADGVLQDVHWYGGIIGGEFQGYTLGNVLSATFYEAAERELGDLAPALRAGEFAPLLGWLRRNVYRHGKKFLASELVERVTGEPMRVEPYLTYLRRKYADLYGVSV